MPFTAPASERLTDQAGGAFFNPDSVDAIEQGFMAGQRELTDADAAAIARRRAEKKKSPSNYVEGAKEAVSGLWDTAKKTAAEQAATALPTPGNTLDRVKAGAEGLLQSGQMMGTIGKDVAEGFVLNPYKVLSKAVQARGLKDTAARLALAAPSLAAPSLNAPTTRLLDVFPDEAASVIRENLMEDREKARDMQKLATGERTLGGEVATALSSGVGLSPETSQKVGETVASKLPATAEAISMVADPTIPATMGASGLLKLGPEAFMKAGARKMATALEAREALRAAAATEGRNIAADQALRLVPDAPPVLVPPIMPSAELGKMGSDFAKLANEAVAANKPGVVQQAVGAAGRGAEAAGKGVEGAAGKVTDFIERNETPLSLLSGAAGLVKGPVAAYVGSKIPAGAKAVATWAKGASKWGTALRTVAEADWASKMPVWRQVANNADAPQWLVKGVTAPIYRNLVAGEAVEKGLRTAGDILGPAAKGAAVGTGLAAADPEKTAEELGGAAATSGVLGLTTAVAGAKSAAKRREAEAFVLSAMRRADQAIREGQNPVAVALTSDSTMVAADMLEKIGQSKMAGGRDQSDLKVSLLDAENFKKEVPPGNAAAYFDTAKNRIVVNIESRDSEGRIFHEGGHALMQSVTAANPVITEHFKRILGPDGLMKAREEYAQALKVDVNTLPTDPAFIVAELFSESTAHVLRGRDTSKAVKGDTEKAAYTFFTDPQTRAAVESPLTQEIVRQQFAALQDYRPAVDMGKETGLKLDAKQAGQHPALPKDSDFVATTKDGRVVEAPPQVVRSKVKSRQAEVDSFFPKADPVADPGQQVQARRTLAGEVQRTGTRLGQRFYDAAQTFSLSTKNLLRQVEQAIADGSALAGWYQEIGRSSEGWKGSVRERLGNLSAQFKDFIPFQFKVSKEGNLLIENYSLTAFERKANEWAQRNGPLSLDAWNGDIGQFRTDVQTYLRNHAEGRPGADGIGETKRNIINVFMVGGNRTFEALNPLRSQATGRDRQGIVRSYRADRLQTLETSDVAGFAAPDYSKQVHNLSPEVDKSFWEGDSKQFSPSLQGEQTEFTPPTKTVKAYKLFRTLKSQPGKLFPLFIGKGEAVPVGEWIPAKFIPTKGFAERPGWHAGVLPNAPHLLSKDGTMPSDRVWAEVEIPADIDWQSRADATPTGDIKSEVPAGGFYTFKRPGLQGGSWVIGGALKINRILSPTEVDGIMAKAGASKSKPVSGEVRNFSPDVPEKGFGNMQDQWAQRLFGVKYSDLGPSQKLDVEQRVRAWEVQNPAGQSNTQTKSFRFKKWFGDWENPDAFSSRNKEGPVSVVVGRDGAPLRVFHSTRENFTAFETGRKTANNYGIFGNVETERHAVFFTDSPQQADAYSKTDGAFDRGSRSVPAYLDIKSPIDFTNSGLDYEGLAQELGVSYNYLRNSLPWELLDGPEGKQFVDAAKKAGYDGVIFTEDTLEAGVRGGRTFAVFEPNQIKSAIGNRGTFDPASKDIRFSPEVQDLQSSQTIRTVPENAGDKENIGGRVPVGRFSVDPTVRGPDFAAAIRRTKEEHPFGFAVDDKGDEFYTSPGTKLFLAEDQLAGVAVTDYGDLVSVFKHPASQADIKPILAEAAQHSQTLDAFDVKGFLPNLYSQLGFRPAARVPFNKEFAPAGWRYDLAGEPDVVLMVRDVNGVSGLPEITNKNYDEIRTKVPAVDYDTAVRLQQEAKARVEQQQQTQQGGGEPMVMSAVNLLYKDSTDLPPPAPGEKRTNGDVARMLQEAALGHWGKILDSTNIEPHQFASLVDNATKEVISALKASGKNAADWYTHAIERAISVLGVIHPELVDDAKAKATNVFPDAKSARLGMFMALAVTSQNLSVAFNSRYALEQFQSLLRTGKFDPSREYGSKAGSISSNLDLANSLVAELGWDKSAEFLSKDFTVKDLEEVASKVLGRDIGIAGRRNDIVQGAAIFGPKIGQGFLQNLLGNYNPVTIDLWMRRTWGRWTGDVMERDVLKPERVARLLDAARQYGIALPSEIKSLRTVVRSPKSKNGQPFSTLSEGLARRLTEDKPLRDVVLRWTGELETLWASKYKTMKTYPVSPADLAALREGKMSFDALADKQLALLKRLDVQWSRLKDKPETGKGPWRMEQMQKLGLTERLTNKDISNTKPEWAYAMLTIQNALGPLDIPSDQDRAVISRLVNEVRSRLMAEGLTTSNADIQAILWYPEKDIWAKLTGEEESNLKQSYDDEFLKIAESRGLGEVARQAAAKSDADRAARAGSAAHSGTASESDSGAGAKSRPTFD